MTRTKLAPASGRKMHSGSVDGHMGLRQGSPSPTGRLPSGPVVSGTARLAISRRLAALAAATLAAAGIMAVQQRADAGPAPSPPAASQQTASSSGGLVFNESALDGGEWQNVVALHPDPYDTPPDPAKSIILTGGDTSGIYRSTDSGLTWEPADSGIQVSNFVDLAVASIMFHGNVAYAAMGEAPYFGGVYVSTNYGQSWSLGGAGCNQPIGSFPKFRGNVFGEGLPGNNNDRRATGNLFAFDDHYIYAGAYGNTNLVGTSAQGVQVSADGGCTWRPLMATATGQSTDPIAATGGYIDSLALYTDPLTGIETLYAAQFLGPVIAYIGPNTAHPVAVALPSPSGTLVAGQGARALQVVGSTLYAAWGSAGVFAWPAGASPSAGATWESLGPPPAPSLAAAESGCTAPPEWVSVNGYLDAAGRTVLFAGSRAAGTYSGQCGLGTVERWSSSWAASPSLAATLGWQNLATYGAPGALAADNVSALEGGPAGSRYWWGCPASGPANPQCAPTGFAGVESAPGGFGFNGNQIALDLSGTTLQGIYVTSTWGLWGAQLASGSASYEWYPMVQGADSVMATDVLATPAMTSSGASTGEDCSMVSAWDWGQFVSPNGFSSTAAQVGPGGGEGTALAADPSGDTAYVASPQGVYETSLLGCSSSGYQWLGASGPNLCAPAAMLDGPAGLLVAGGGRACTGASSPGGSIWWIDPSAAGSTWQATTPEVSEPGGEIVKLADPTQFAWPAGPNATHSRYLYAYDPTSGVWRWDTEAADPASGWTLIWQHTTPQSWDYGGGIVATMDPVLDGSTFSGDVVYASVDDGVYEIEGASSCTGACPQADIVSTGFPTTGSFPTKIAIASNGTLFVAGVPGSIVQMPCSPCDPPTMWSYDPATTSPAWSDALSSTDTTYQAVAFLPTSLAIGPLNSTTDLQTIYETLAGQGLIYASIAAWPTAVPSPPSAPARPAPRPPSPPAPLPPPQRPRSGPPGP